MSSTQAKIKIKESLIYLSSRRMPGSSVLKFLDSGIRRNDESVINQRFLNKSQVVHLPKAVALPESVSVVDIEVVGNARVITPAGESWDVWFDGPGVSDDFLTLREQPGAR